jgi:hypothetical protein
LRHWLESSHGDAITTVEDIATALVTLSCAYDSPVTLVRTVHVLKNVESKYVDLKVDASDVINRLLSSDEDQVSIL